jgi:hypothetical protein
MMAEIEPTLKSRGENKKSQTMAQIQQILVTPSS